MGLIDWSQARGPIPNAAPEIAHIGGLIDAFAERRIKLAQMEQAKAEHDAQLAELARHNQADEGYNQQQLQELSGYHTATNEATKANNQANVDQKRGDDYRALVEKHQSGAIDDNAFAAGLRSLGMATPPPPIQAASSPSPAGPGASAAPPPLEPPPFNPDAGGATQPSPVIAGAPGAVNDAMSAAPRSAAPMAPPPAPPPGMPAGPGAALDAFGYDVGSRQKTRAARAAENQAALEAHAKRVISALPPEQRRFATNAAAFAISEAGAALGAKPEEALKTFNAKFDEYFRADQTRGNAYIAAKSQEKNREQRPASESQGLAASRLTVMIPEAKRIENLPPLSPEGRQVLFEELAAKNAAEKAPTVDALARYAGLRKSVSARLSGTDKRVYPAYLSFGDPLVRQRSGANAPPAEVANLLDPIMPAIDDGADELADKRVRRRDILHSFVPQTQYPDEWIPKIESIYAGPSAPAPEPSTPAGVPSGLKRIRDMKRGTR